MSHQDEPRRERGGADPERPPGVPPHQPPPEEAGKDEIEEEDEVSFPSSDPPSTGGPGL